MRRPWILPLLVLGLTAPVAVAQETVPSGETPAPQPVQTTTICHATFDPDPPYLTLELGADQLAVHQGHPADWIPAPPGGCPLAVQVDEEPEPEPEPEPQVEPEPDQQLAPQARSTPPAATPPSVASSAARRTTPMPSSSLPYTGWEPAPLLLLGFAAVFAGLGVWYRWAGPDAVAAAWHAVRLPGHLSSISSRRPQPDWLPPQAPAPAPPPRDELDEMRDVVSRIEALRAELRDPDR